MLVVDDEDAIRFSMKEYFTTLGYQVDCAREMEEAQALLTKGHYTIVIVDLRLTGSHSAEGLKILAFVRERCPSTRVIVLTAYGSAKIEAEAWRLGVDSFMHKPIPLGQLARIVLGLAQVEG